MTETAYLWVSAAVMVLMLGGIKLLGSPRTAVVGNRLGAFAVLGAITVALVQAGVVSLRLLVPCLAVGAAVGVVLAVRVTTVRIPQLVALFNGFGGLASLLVASVVAVQQHATTLTADVACVLAILVGGVTFSGSVVAAGKLEKRIRQQPIVMPAHSVVSILLLVSMAAVAVLFPLADGQLRQACTGAALLASLLFGVAFSIRIGGADMPVTISLLNSCSGLAVAVCGFALHDIMLIGGGAIVGAAGLLLTRIMCRAMHRSLLDILTGRTAYRITPGVEPAARVEEPTGGSEEDAVARVAQVLAQASSVVVVPGYGMALAQAQQQVKNLYKTLTARGADVAFAIHPVAGRMPGHMNVLLAEVDIPYELLRELEEMNPRFAQTDVAVVVGACDVVNEAAITAKGTPIYGMPVLHVHEAKSVAVFNLDEKPGYSGVPNPLYDRANVTFVRGNASETLERLLGSLTSAE
jgi:NAD(P) transhydrogenase subunit beta